MFPKNPNSLKTQSRDRKMKTEKQKPKELNPKTTSTETELEMLSPSDELKTLKPESSALSPEIETIVSYDENLLERTRTQWQFGDWQNLAKIQADSLEHHPDRATLALFSAAGNLQMGNMAQARQLVFQAVEWGCEKNIISRILIGGVYNSLGCAAASCDHLNTSYQYFIESITTGMPGSETKLFSKARVQHQYELIQKANHRFLVHTLLMNNREDKSGRIDNSYAPFGQVNKSPQSLKIIIAGMRHSGSTALFNIIRLGLEYMNINFLSGYSEQKFLINSMHPLDKLCLIKTHELRDDIASSGGLIITTRRDLRDTVASAMRRKFPIYERLNGPIEYAKYNRMLHDVWLPFSDYVFNYESFIANPIVSIKKLFNFLNIDQSMAEKVNKDVIELPLDKYDVTLLTPTHITDPDRMHTYLSTLGESEAKTITSQHYTWLFKYGYV
jgi:hypothetical protein